MFTRGRSAAPRAPCPSHPIEQPVADRHHDVTQRLAARGEQVEMFAVRTRSGEAGTSVPSISGRDTTEIQPGATPPPLSAARSTTA